MEREWILVLLSGPDTIPPTVDIITPMVVNLLAQVRQLLSSGTLMMTG